MDKKVIAKDAMLAAAAVVGLSTGLLLDIKFNAKDGVKIGKMPITIGVSQAAAQSTCNCCNDGGNGTCAGR